MDQPRKFPISPLRAPRRTDQIMSRRLLMLASLLVLTALVSVARANAQATAQATAPTTVPAAPQSNLLKPEELKKIDKYLRNLFAWGPDFQLKLGTVVPSPSPEI